MEEGNLFRIALVECDVEITLAPIANDGVPELKAAFALRVCDKFQHLKWY